MGRHYLNVNMKEVITLRREKMDELFTELYKEENEKVMNLFCVSLISSDSVLTEHDCLKNMDVLNEFKVFIQNQSESKKKQDCLAFIETAEEILSSDLVELNISTAK